MGAGGWVIREVSPGHITLPTLSLKFTTLLSLLKFSPQEAQKKESASDQGKKIRDDLATKCETAVHSDCSWPRERHHS